MPFLSLILINFNFVLLLHAQIILKQSLMLFVSLKIWIVFVYVPQFPFKLKYKYSSTLFEPCIGWYESMLLLIKFISLIYCKGSLFSIAF